MIVGSSRFMASFERVADRSFNKGFAVCGRRRFDQ
jgi:hypothetical protein